MCAVLFTEDSNAVKLSIACMLSTNDSNAARIPTEKNLINQFMCAVLSILKTAKQWNDQKISYQ